MGILASFFICLILLLIRKFNNIFAGYILMLIIFCILAANKGFSI
jgi:hypothetical protein